MWFAIIIMLALGYYIHKKNKAKTQNPSVNLDNFLRILRDENMQNRSYPDFLQKRVLRGADIDSFSNTMEDFGRTPDNPIPVNGYLGEIVYLSLLKSPEGKHLIFHRLGALNGIDVYETVSLDGTHWDILYFSMYHPRRSRKAPLDYSLLDSNQPFLLLGTNLYLPEFPHGLRQAIMELTINILGMPMYPPIIREIEEQNNFVRPAEHCTTLSKVRQMLTSSQS